MLYRARWGYKGFLLRCHYRGHTKKKKKKKVDPVVDFLNLRRKRTCVWVLLWAAGRRSFQILQRIPFSNKVSVAMILSAEGGLVFSYPRSFFLPQLSHFISSFCDELLKKRPNHIPLMSSLTSWLYFSSALFMHRLPRAQICHSITITAQKGVI